MLTHSLRIFLLSHNAEIPLAFPFLYSLQYSIKGLYGTLRLIISVTTNLGLDLSLLSESDPLLNTGQETVRGHNPIVEATSPIYPCIVKCYHSNLDHKP